MKKILFLLLFTIASYGQAVFDEGVQIKNNQTSTTATKVNVQENDGTINTKPLSELDNYLEFASAVNLPVTGEQGKLYLTKDNNRLYRFNGTIYQELTTDETTATIQAKRPLKTIENQSLEGSGNIDLSKSDVGLGNVDNTSDVNKPISTATQTALNGKENSFTKNTAFNKNFGTAAGTVVEGGTLGSNAYTSTAYLPLSGGTLSGNLNVNSILRVGDNSYNSTIDQAGIGKITSEFTSGRSYTKFYGHTGNAENYLILSIDGLGNSTFTGTVTATSYTGGATLTGTPTAPTAPAGTNTTQIATTAFVQAVDANVVHKTGEETIGLGEKYFTDNVNFTDIAVSGQATGVAADSPNEFVIKSQLDLKAPLSSPTFTGTVTAPTAAPGTNTTQIATTAFVQGIRPYKVYTALISQTGTNAPTAIVLENTLGGTIVWSYSITGEYIGTLNGAFLNNKTFLNIKSNTHSSNTEYTSSIGRINIDKIVVGSKINGTSSDGAMLASIEIRVYN